MNFKNQIETAVTFHEDETGEEVTNTYLAAILFPKSNPKTQKTRLSQSKNRGIKLNKDQKDALLACFPKIPPLFWAGDVETTRLIEALNLIRQRFTVDEIEESPELNIIYIMLISGYYPKALVNKYLKDK